MKWGASYTCICFSSEGVMAGAQPRLLSVPELCYCLAESCVTFRLYLQELLQYKRQNPAKVNWGWATPTCAGDPQTLQFPLRSVTPQITRGMGETLGPRFSWLKPFTNDCWCPSFTPPCPGLQHEREALLMSNCVPSTCRLGPRLTPYVDGQLFVLFVP